MVLSESWLEPDSSNDEVLWSLPTHFRSDKTDRPGGGMVIYVRESIFVVWTNPTHAAEGIYGKTLWEPGWTRLRKSLSYEEAVVPSIGHPVKTDQTAQWRS